MKRKRTFKIIITILLLITIIGSLKIIPVIIRGYDMYKDAIDEESVAKVVEDIKNDPSYITIDNISEEFLEQVIQSEDQRFYKHGGIDVISITRAMFNNLKAGKFIQGGSTITQQLSKNMYFSFDKKIERKVAEVFVANDLEKMYTKDEILELYCNVVYFGEGCYGLKEASKHYYGVDARILSKQQAKELVYTIKSPNNYNPNALAKAS